MKIFRPYPYFFIAFLSLLFIGCENEPLEGEFITDDPLDNTAEEGEFVATVGGETFVAESTQVIYFSQSNILSITGLKSSTGESITLAIENPSVGEFDLSQGTGSQNGAAYIDGAGTLPNPYVSAVALGGTGTLNLSEYNTDEQTITGTFAFSAGRIQLDDAGNPVIGSDGSPVIETININAGAFNTIPYTIDDTMGGGSGGGTDPDELFAQVDGTPFEPVSVTVSQYMVGMQPMIQIIAKDTVGASIRLDVPETLQTGTFDLFNGISDGAQLIGYYNANNGGENLSSNPGSITITEFSSQTGKLVANFSFTANDPLNEDPTVVEITEGTLDVTFVPTPGNISFFFQAEVDGNLFDPEIAMATQDTFEGVSIVRISANIGNRVMEIVFPASIGAGTYGMSPMLVTGSEVVGSYNPDVVNVSAFTSDPGTLEIISFDVATGVIEGTFSFSAKDPTNEDPTVYEVTNGEFLVELQ